MSASKQWLILWDMDPHVHACAMSFSNSPHHHLRSFLAHIWPSLTFFFLPIFPHFLGMIYQLSTMRSTPSPVKQFLKKWIKGMKVCNSSIKKSSILERKNTIKLSADIAIASTRTTRWRRAVITNASKDPDNKHLIERILGESDHNSTCVELHCARLLRIGRSKKKKKRIGWRVWREKKATMTTTARVLSKRLVRKRTRVLKNLVPGGETMDECSLMKEAIDYIISLQTQVDGMKHLLNAVTTFKS